MGRTVSHKLLIWLPVWLNTGLLETISCWYWMGDVGIICCNLFPQNPYLFSRMTDYKLTNQIVSFTFLHFLICSLKTAKLCTRITISLNNPIILEHDRRWLICSLKLSNLFHLTFNLFLQIAKFCPEIPTFISFSQNS